MLSVKPRAAGGSPMAASIDRHALHVVPVSAKTAWIVVELTLASGESGLGEVSLFGQEHGVAQAAAGLLGALTGTPIDAAAGWVARRRMRMRDPMSALLLSGIEAAVIDARARSLGIEAAELLGGRVRGRVRLYANVNRGTADRTPGGWAARARAAVADGFGALKMAPFDGMGPHEPDGPEAAARLAHGLACVAAARDAVGPEVAINVDCHARLGLPAARAAIREMGRLGVHWVEEPVREDAAPAELRALRGLANGLGMRLAGAEGARGLGEVVRLTEAGALDVYLPDIRHCGGVREALRIAAFLADRGLEFSLHNPAGPVLDAVTLVAAACAPAVTMVERQYREHPLHAVAVGAALGDARAGGEALAAPRAPGWGVGARPGRARRARPGCRRRGWTRWGRAGPGRTAERPRHGGPGRRPSGSARRRAALLAQHLGAQLGAHGIVRPRARGPASARRGPRSRG